MAAKKRAKWAPIGGIFANLRSSSAKAALAHFLRMGVWTRGRSLLMEKLG
jgi:hypothetical protein